MSFTPSKRAFEGLKVVELSWVVAAPLIGTFLANFGADVVKVESINRPDLLRTMTPFKDHQAGINMSGYFAACNNSKYSIALDLAKPRGVDVLKRLIDWSDVLIENMTPGAMERLGLSYDQLEKTNPGLIVVSVSDQGQTGPRARQAGFGLFAAALMGVMDACGWPDRQPAGPVCPLPDFISPIYGVIAIIAALEHRRKSGLGQHIDISQMEVMGQSMAVAYLEASANGRAWSRQGNHYPLMVPHGVYRCRGEDRWCAIAVRNDAEWQSLCRAMQMPSLARDARFCTLSNRFGNKEKVDEIIGQWTLQHSPENLMTLLQEHGVPAGIVSNARDVHEDPYLWQRGHYEVLHHAEMGECVYELPAARLSETPARIDRPAPCLGQDTEFVCCSLLGMTSEKFIDLFQQGVFE